jgi:hypothetical protein
MAQLESILEITMTMTRTHLIKSLCAFSVTALLAVTATAQIASGTTGIDNTGNAASEMAACNNGTTQQSRETCMTEVRNANAAKRAGKVDNAGGQFKANALMRCDVLQGEDKTACQARVSGYGNPEGSVAGGGVLTQVETVVVPKSPEVINIQPQTSSDTIILIPAK